VSVDFALIRIMQKYKIKKELPNIDSSFYELIFP